MNKRMAQVAHGRGRDYNQRRTALIDSISGEFRVPLASMKAAISTLLTDPRLRASQCDGLLPAIADGADRLSRLVRGAVEVSRFDPRARLDRERHAAAVVPSQRPR